jgi:hydroxymethylpyrimidine/phosphomethylpyrimidine kinase
VILWVLGGRDPTGGAGVDRDRATAATVAPELELAVLVTADTDQGDGRPARAHARAPLELARELATLPAPSAVKLGLVPDAAVDPVLAALRPLSCPIVLDPVLVASDGGALGSSAAGLRRLVAIATLVTPNRAEAAALADAVDVVAALRPAAVLLKDAESDPSRVVDMLALADAVHRFDRPRRPGADPRGTGCALATAIACHLARGVPLPDACARAIAWLDDARTRTHPGPDGRPHL